MVNFVTAKMKVQYYTVTVVLLLATIFTGGHANQNPSKVDDELVPEEYILTGTVMHGRRVSHHRT